MGSAYLHIKLSCRYAQAVSMPCVREKVKVFHIYLVWRMNDDLNKLIFINRGYIQYPFASLYLFLNVSNSISILSNQIEVICAIICIYTCSCVSSRKLNKPTKDPFIDFVGDPDLKLITDDDERPPTSFTGNVMQAKITSLKNSNHGKKFGYK